MRKEKRLHLIYGFLPWFYESLQGVYCNRELYSNRKLVQNTICSNIWLARKNHLIKRSLYPIAFVVILVPPFGFLFLYHVSNQRKQASPVSVPNYFMDLFIILTSDYQKRMEVSVIHREHQLRVISNMTPSRFATVDLVPCTSLTCIPCRTASSKTNVSILLIKGRSISDSAKPELLGVITNLQSALSIKISWQHNTD